MGKSPSNSVTRRAYTGALNEPIVAGAARENELEQQYILGNWDAKLKLLFDHYRIEFNEPGCWENLAIALAFDHVPGFRVVVAGAT